MIDKSLLVKALRAALAAEIATLRASEASAREGATHEEAKPEDDKDTRALEQSYVERGQAKRVLDLENAVADTEKMALRAFGEEDPIALGALVFVMDDDAEKTFFLAPAGGGHKVGAVQIVTPEAPIGRALLGKHAGDEPEVIIAGKKRTLEIVRVE